MLGNVNRSAKVGNILQRFLKSKRSWNITVLFYSSLIGFVNTAQSSDFSMCSFCLWTSSGGCPTPGNLFKHFTDL